MGWGGAMPRLMKSASSFRYFNSSPEIIRLLVMMYVRFPLSLRKVEDLVAERGIDICHETVRHWWNRFGRCSLTMLGATRGRPDEGLPSVALIPRRGVCDPKGGAANINDEMHTLGRTVDQEGKVLESYVTRTFRSAALAECQNLMA